METREALAEQVRAALKDVPNFIAVARRVGCSKVFLLEVRRGTRVPTARRSQSILSAIASTATTKEDVKGNRVL